MMMRKLLPALAFTLLLPFAATAHADEAFLTCPSGRSGVATLVTSCAFADNVRASLLTQGGLVVTAYSPVTGESYQMQCYDRFVAHFNDSWTVFPTTKCTGGDNAVVFVW